MGGKKIGLDVGSYSLKICADFRNELIEIPCMAATDRLTGKLLSYGAESQRMSGRAPATVELKRFIENGAANDFGLTARVLADVFDKLLGQRVLRPDVVACVGVGATELEKKMLADVLQASGAARVYTIVSPVAASIGYFGPTPTPRGRAVLDVGAGAADFAVVTMNGVATRKAVPAAGAAMTKALTDYLAAERNVVIGEAETERLKKELACVYPREPELAYVAGGKKLTGEALSFELTSTEVSKALRPCFEQIMQLVVSVLDETEPELVGDIRRSGILLTGGCAEIPGLDRYLRTGIGVSVTVPDKPALCAVKGIKKILRGLKKFEQNGTISS